MDLIVAMVGGMLFAFAYGGTRAAWTVLNMPLWGDRVGINVLFWVAFITVGPFGVLTLYFLARAIWFGGAA